MPDETPRPKRDSKERGLRANHREDPTLRSYLSSAFLALSVPAFVGMAIGGYLLEVYPYALILPVFAGLLFSSVVLAFAVMHVR